MINPVSPEAAARREADREAGGRFGSRLHPEPGIALAQAPEGPDALVDRMRRDHGVMLAGRWHSLISRTSTDEGKALAGSFLEASLDGRQPLSAPAVDPEDLDTLGRLGHTYETLVPDAERVFGHDISPVAAERITPERLALIAFTGKSVNSWSRWEREALLTAPERYLRAAARLPESDTAGRYKHLIHGLGPEKAERLAEARRLGISTPALIESRHPLPLLAELRDALPPKDRIATVAMADMGHTAQTIRRYGYQLASRFPASDLERLGMPAEVADRLFQGSGMANTD